MDLEISGCFFFSNFVANKSIYGSIGFCDVTDLSIY